MKALLVEHNGKRVRLAGCASDDWGLLAIVEYGREDDHWTTRLDVTVRDPVKQEGYSWKMQPLTRGEFVTMQLVDAEVVDAAETSIPLSQAGHTVPEGLPTATWPPPSEAIDAMHIELNGERIWLAGVVSQEWSTIACFEHLKLQGEWSTSLHVMVQDKSRGTAGGWPERQLKPGDVATFRLVEKDEVDEFEIWLPTQAENSRGLSENEPR